MKHTKICSDRLRRILALCLALLMVLPLAACGENRKSQRELFAMDTIMTLTAYGKDGEKGLDAAVSVIQAMDVMLDPELSTSTVYAINHANGQSVVVSAQVAKMLTTAMTVYEQSGGALDLSIYPLVKRWGFVDQKYYKPTEAEIAEDLSRLCYDKLSLTSFPASGSYYLTIPEYGQLSFGAVAKGCSAENAIDAMRQAGVKSGIISLGGNVQTLGVKPDGSLWKVAIQDPENTDGYVGTISVGETAVVTSAAYQEKFVAMNGKTYHHLLNPASGYPANNSLSSVTIICEDGTMADCLSTAMFVMGETKALNYWRQYGGFEMILVTDSKRVVCTSGLIEKFTLVNDSYTLKFSE